MTTPRQDTPCKDDLLKLPRWARVAFAVRCARRVQPFVATWKAVSKKQVEAVEAALSLCEASARSGRVERLLQAASECAHAVYEAALYHPEHDDEDAATAAHVASDAGECAAEEDNDAAAALADLVVGASCFASFYRHADEADLIAFRKAAWSDYDRLVEMASERAWNDATPVDVDDLGPL